MAMNKEEAISSEEAKDLSDQSSTSPAQSGSSNPYNGLSSQETTPPPFSDSSSAYPESSLNRWAVRSQSNRDYPMRYSYGGEFSVGSAPSLLSPIHDASPGQSPFPGHLGMPTGVRGGEDMAGLAAAIEMLSSNFQTPESRPHHPDTGVPPVPALPSHFQPYRKEINLHSQQPIDFPLSSTGISHRQSFTRGTSGNQLGTSRKEDMDDHVFGRMDE